MFHKQHLGILVVTQTVDSSRSIFINTSVISSYRFGIFIFYIDRCINAIDKLFTDSFRILEVSSFNITIMLQEK